MEKLKKTLIAIDPGATTGLAIWDGTVLKLDSGSFWDMIYFIEPFVLDNLTPNGIPFEFHIEDPGMNKLTFRRDGNIGTDDRKARNVGMNIRDAQLWMQWCEFQRFPFVQRKPLRKTNNDGTPKWKGIDGKITAEEFNAITQYNMPTNQHERDSCLIILPYILEDSKK